MRIRRLEIENFRVFARSVTFEFSDRFTVVAGINGRGKTAILDAIALLSSRLLPQISPARGTQRKATAADVRLGAAQASLAMATNCAGIPLEYRLTFDRETGQTTADKLQATVKRAVQDAYGDPTRADDAAPLVVYYTTDRARYSAPKKTLPVLPRGQAAAYPGSLKNRLIDFRDFVTRYRNYLVLDAEHRQENPDYIGEHAVSAISRAITNFLGEFTDLRVEEEPLRLLVNKNGISLDLSQLSDGERSFLAIICDLGKRLALANPELDDPLQGAGVVLIDELELHLHPRWQREVVEKLRSTFPHIQFIATTHSPFVIQSLRSGELISLDPDVFKLSAEYADKSIEDIAENVMGVDLPQKSQRYLQMMEAAEEYFLLLREPKVDGDAIERAEKRLNELSIPFSDDPAFQALLKLERETQRGGNAASR